LVITPRIVRSIRKKSETNFSLLSFREKREKRLPLWVGGAMKGQAANRVSVVIPSWNGRELLAACLESLSSQSYGDFETIVVDDGSTDGSSEMVRACFPETFLLTFEGNRGFCHAVNAGIDRTHGELIVLLNNDMTLAPDFLEKLVAAADSSEAGMFAPLILWRDEPDVVYSAGDAQRRNGRPEAIGFRAALGGFAFPEKIFGVCAGAAMYRRELFDAVGMLDPIFEIYFSDGDLSFRARLAGYGAELVRGAVAWHVGSASLFGKPLKRTRQCCVNHALLVLRNMPGRLIARHAAAIAGERAHQVRRLFSASRAEYGAIRAAADVAQTLAHTASLIPRALSARRRIQRLRKIDVSELDRLLSK
jgi:GT2 family glycosyltransferase